MHQIAELPDIRRKDKEGLDHVANLLGILTFVFVSLSWLGVLGVSKSNETAAFKDFEHRYPVFPRRFHADSNKERLVEPSS